MHIVERGSGTPIVLIHGFGVDHRVLTSLDDVIANAGGWRRLYVDLPGHGRSAGDGVSSTDEVAEAVKAAIQDRLGDAAFAVIGNSFGGMIARRVAHDLRDRILGLATVAGVFIASVDDRTVPERSLVLEDAALVESLGDAGGAFADMAVVHTAENAQAFLRHVQPGLEAADQATMDRIADEYGFAEEPEEESPDPFTAPSLFLMGRQDHVVGYEDAWARQAHYPRATFATLDSAGHNVHLERPEVANVLMLDWLQRMRAEAQRTA
ncbi:alpha/beta fold hydrolase [Demequina capsici]|uniref:Alpha/beta hydrolase n=1 Tax=Demequina capsici TaxID=3075620 RepID=A0AA96J6U3_9MICO|nr:alpha/beta hydrolase [Demequina sp. OYTSA14]WNM23293.1 alpha/beta hydrolase [Demequina sp. OYTSA14]